MKVIVVKDYKELSAKAFEVMKDVVKNPRCVLGMATGSSPIGLYENMIQDHKNNQTSYKDVITFNLDEYVNLDIHHPESYYSFMHKHLFDAIDIQAENVHIPVGNGNLEQNCLNYEEQMRKHVIDLQILGVGANGHIGFNEPGTSFDSLTHIVDLQEKTIADNARFFDGNMDLVPKQAITMGIATIMRAKKILLVASGENKAQAIYQMVKGEVTPNCPATILQKHQDVVVIVDEAAAKLL